MTIFYYYRLNIIFFSNELKYSKEKYYHTLYSDGRIFTNVVGGRGMDYLTATNHCSKIVLL